VYISISYIIYIYLFVLSYSKKESNKQSTKRDIEEILLQRRTVIKNNPIRTELMIKAEAYVRKFNEDHPASPIEVTSDVLELVAKKCWTEVRITQTIIN
jgi:hypothetical protein